MSFHTRTLYVAQNRVTLQHLRNTNITIEQPFDESTPECVQTAWNSGINMRNLSDSRPYLSKATVMGARICFVSSTGKFAHFIDGDKQDEINALITQPN